MRDLTESEIPKVEVIRQFYTHGRIDEGAVYETDMGRVLFLGHGLDGDVRWSPTFGCWVYEPGGIAQDYGMTGLWELLGYDSSAPEGRRVQLKKIPYV